MLFKSLSLLTNATRAPRRQSLLSRGFTMIELMITAAIIVIISALIIINYSGFNSSVLLKNQAYEIALALRQAQVYSVSARGQNGAFREEYGIYINRATDAQEVIVYSTDPENDGYEDVGAGPPVILERIRLDSRFTITSLCRAPNAGTACTSLGNSLSVQFARPNFDPFFIRGTTLLSNIAADEIRIGIQPVMGDQYRTINISSTGRIEVGSLQTL